MLRLPYAGNFIFIDPEKIRRVVPVVIKGNDIGHCDIYTDETYSQRVEVSAVDVCRLKAAWELRYSASKIVENNDVPIYIYMAENGFQFVCCDYVRRQREEAVATVGSEQGA